MELGSLASLFKEVTVFKVVHVTEMRFSKN